MKPHIGWLVAGFALAIVGLVGPANAGSVTIANTTSVEAFKGTSSYSFFGGTNPSWGSYSSTTPKNNIGGPNTPGGADSVFSTTQIQVSTPAVNTVDLTFTTAFNGDFTGYDTKADGYILVKYADIFIQPVGVSGATTAPPSSYGYSIALGDQQKSKGVYSVSGYETSEQIWGSRTKFVYGGEYAPGSCTTTKSGTTCTPNTAEAHTAPTVLTSGTLVTSGSGSNLVGFTVNVEPYNTTNDTLTVQISTPNTTAGTSLFNKVFGTSGFDLFWGTGDCSNAPLYVSTTLPKVPEPTSSIMMLATALVGWGFLRRRRSARPIGVA